MNKLSARHFKDPLILTLGELSHFQEGCPVYFKDTYATIIEKMGICLEDYGYQPSTGQLWVTQWIGFAFKALRSASPALCQQNMKGRWELTEPGLERAKFLSSHKEISPAGSTAPAATKSEKAPVIHGGVSLNLSAMAMQKTGFYHTDSYLRGLAIEATRCFGNWSTKSTICKRCPLVQSCKEAMAFGLSALNRQWEVKEKEASEPTAPVETPVEVATEEAPVEPKPTTGDAQLIQNVPVATECYVCNGAIEKSAKCYWIKPHGMAHIECHKKG
jgi:hypothetical protein